MKEVNFETINNKKIFYIFTKPADKVKRLVIMSHGFRGDSTGPSRAFVDFEKTLLDNGFSVLRFDQPNSGNSEGDFIDSSFKEWIETIVYFAKKYLELDYQVFLMGQSMGATATMVAAGKKELRNKIPCVLLWVPDPKTNINVDAEKIYQEGGQKYKGRFWLEARESDFFKALKNYLGGIHLVYGEKDKYISKKLRNKTIEKVKAKNQPYLVLAKQDHSPWDPDLLQKVYKKEVDFLQRYS